MSAKASSHVMLEHYLKTLKLPSILRFTGTIAPGLYADCPEGAAPRLALYNIKTDPAETKDLKDQMPERVETMKAEYLKRTTTFTPPGVWSRDKWEELLK